ncbi:MAG: hypothetical protein AB7T49_04835 [Oligoflexales bacterium]
MTGPMFAARRAALKLPSLLLVLLFAQSGSAFEIPERRREQKQVEPGHILTPAAANIPGIGFTYGILGSYFNAFDTEADVLGFLFSGDLAGAGVATLNIPTFWEPLTVNLFANSFTKIAAETYNRGIDSDPDDRYIVELDNADLLATQFNLNFLGKRLQFNLGVNQQGSRLRSLRDKDGKKISDVDADKHIRKSYSAGTIIDLTDDHDDPRKGMQLEVYAFGSPRESTFSADYYTVDYNFLGYVPFGSFSTVVFNAYRSDAVVARKGESDEDAIKKDLGYKCDEEIDDARDACLATEEKRTREIMTQNTHGTASPIGGTQRLRSYPTNRFFAAHTVAYSAEIRYNLTEEFSKFNIYIASGVRTSMQLALFYDIGSVAETASDLHDDMKYSVGGGLRLVMASGIVLRGDYGVGEEGGAATLIFQYPYSLF